MSESSVRAGAVHRHDWERRGSCQVLILLFQVRGWSKAPLTTCPGHRVLQEELHLAPLLKVSCSSPVPSPSQPCLLLHFDLSPIAMKHPCLCHFKACLFLMRNARVLLEVWLISCTSSQIPVVLSNASKMFEDARRIMSSGFFPL